MLFSPPSGKEAQCMCLDPTQCPGKMKCICIAYFKTKTVNIKKSPAAGKTQLHKKTMQLSQR